MGDNGEVLQRLNERWSFLGANATEWACGIAVFCMISLFGAQGAFARVMPFMLIGGILTPMILASLRVSFPDEERGVRNALSVACGFNPFGIPAPSSIQPVWSASPLKEVKQTSKFKQYGLDEIFPSHIEVLIEDID